MDKKALLEQFKAEVEASGTSLTHILKMCEFDEVGNDFRSDKVHDYSIGCLNGAWWMFQRQQAKVEELQKQFDQHDKLLLQRNKDVQELYDINAKHGVEKAELQKRVDAVKGLAQTLWEKSNEKHNQGKVWESKALGECADEILDVLEQALKGEG
ncbi:TPA: hypothetical protein VAM24_003824 [Acinetobacter baumannii]|nr:hypothetical protein [Acinetobacter baumannii]HEO1779361.1 hypothetical protein [Acinetobacter baumannii]